MNNTHPKSFELVPSCISVISLDDLFNSSRGRFNGPLFDSNTLSGTVESNDPLGGDIVCECVCTNCIIWEK